MRQPGHLNETGQNGPARKDRPRVRLCPLGTDAADELAGLFADSVDFHRPWVCYPITLEDVRGYITQSEAGGGYLFAVRRVDDDVLVGLISLSRIARGAWQTAECGCAVAVRHRGHGYLTEALALCVDKAMADLGLHRIEALVHEDNKPSQRMLASAGFRPEGVARASVFVSGAWLDHVRWAITAEDLNKSGPAARGGGELNDDPDA
jgi:ribosomal-protein-alanine N-acetyltransferase